MTPAPIAGQRKGTSRVEVTGSEITPQDRVRLTRLARELRLTDQILSTDLDTVSIVDNGPAPAWTTLDGDHVSFALSKMPMPKSRTDLAVWLGTNAHELGHVLYSPRTDSDLMRRVLAGDRGFMRGLAMIHNIVEDQRQERLLLARFSPWSTYLIAALGHHIKADAESAWILLAGRTWLPDAIRAQAKAEFIGEFGISAADSVSRIVGEYQKLLDPGDTEAVEAWELLEELYELLGTHLPQIPPCQFPGGGDPDTSDPGESAPDTADEAEASGGADSPEEGEAEGPTGDGDEENESKGRGKGDADSHLPPSDSSGGSGAGSAPTDPIQARIRKELSKAVAQDVRENAEAREDLDSIMDALDHGRSGDDLSAPDTIGQNVPATDAARRLHHEVGDALLDLKDASEPGWMKRTDSGRLNVRRLLSTTSDADELFDRYEPGMMDASELELVLLLDVSGSMQSSMLPLAEATWAIRQAVDDLEGEATVITFDSGPHRILARAGERPDDRMMVPTAMGGTTPRSAIIEGFQLLADSQARNRLMVILTDGYWYDEGPSRQTIVAANEAGIITVCALLDAHDENPNLHGCQFGGSIDNLPDLARLFKTVAEAQIGAWT